jgi:hypothetical protein
VHARFILGRAERPASSLDAAQRATVARGFLTSLALHYYYYYYYYYYCVSIFIIIVGIFIIIIIIIIITEL